MYNDPDSIKILMKPEKRPTTNKGLRHEVSADDTIKAGAEDVARLFKLGLSNQET